MTIERFKQMSESEIQQYGKKLPYGRYFDKNGNMLSANFAPNNWEIWTYDKHGNVLTYIASDPYWRVRTRDSDGNQIAYSDSEGTFKILGRKVSEDEYDKFIKNN